MSIWPDFVRGLQAKHHERRERAMEADNIVYGGGKHKQPYQFRAHEYQLSGALVCCSRHGGFISLADSHEFLDHGVKLVLCSECYKGSREAMIDEAVRTVMNPQPGDADHEFWGPTMAQMKVIRAEYRRLADG